MTLYCVVIMKPSNGVTVVPDTWIVGGKKVEWPKCTPEKRHRLCVRGEKYTGICDEYDVVIYGVYTSYTIAQSNVKTALADTDGASTDATFTMTHRPKRITKKRKRLAESTTEVSSTDLSSNEDLDVPLKFGRSATPCHVIEVSTPPNPFKTLITPLNISPDLGPPTLHSSLIGHTSIVKDTPFSNNYISDENIPPNNQSSCFIPQPCITCAPSTSNRSIAEQHVLQRIEAKIDSLSNRLDTFQNLYLQKNEKINQHSELLQSISRQLMQMSSMRSISNSNAVQQSVTSASNDNQLLESIPQLLASDSDFDAMELFLGDEKQRMAFVEHMSKLGGSSAGELMRNILTNTISLPFANAINLTGRNNKRAMKGSKFFRSIKAAIRRTTAYSNCTDFELQTAAREWLHNCRQRKDSEVRRSYSKSGGGTVDND